MARSRPACYKDFPIKPLAGGLDTRSDSGEVTFGDFRLILNMDGHEERAYCRLGGWQPYLRTSEFGFKNQDLHDQMVGGQYYKVAYTIEHPATHVFTGYQYPVFYPAEYVPDYSVEGPPLGPFCGYALSSPYLFGTIVNGFGITSWSAGPPYEYILDADCVGNGGGPPDAGLWRDWTVDVRSTPFTASHTHILAVALHWSSAQFGPGNVTQTTTDPGPDAQTHTFTFCVPPDATGVSAEQLSGNITSGPTQTATTCGATVESMSGTDAPPNACVDANCYIGSFYYLAYTHGYPGFTVPAYYGGDPVPVFTDTAASSESGCYDHLYYLTNTCREAITGLYSMNSVGGRRRLVATTRSRIYVNDDRAGNWRIIADGLGGGCDQEDDCTCSRKRIKMAATGNSMLFVNGIDPVIVWAFDEGPSGCFFWSADYVAELRQLEIETARVVQCWRGFAFIADTTENGARFTSRLYWSDYNAPTSWTPGGESLAGRHDFGNGETILAMEPIGGRLRIYTDKAIYDAVLVSDPEMVFSFQEIYRGEDVLRYPNTLVNTGDSHVWFGQESIFELTETARTPIRLDWVHRACGAIFNGIKTEWVDKFDGLPPFGPINSDRCEQAVGGWDGENKAVWFSWPTAGNECPNMTLILWPRYRKASIVDAGFTAFVTHKPDYGQTIRDFLAENHICSPASLVVAKEGLPIDVAHVTPEFAYLYNSHEDPAYPRDPNSAIASLCGICLADLCIPCTVAKRFLMASAEDKTIKEFTPDQYVREMFDDATDPIVIKPPPSVVFPQTTVGLYGDTGYFSMMQSDPSDYTTPSEKMLNAANVSFTAADQVSSGQLNMQIAFGPQPECLSWQDSDPVDLMCLDGPDYDETMNQRPAIPPRFAFLAAGTFLGWRLWTSGLGGQFCLNSVTLSVRRSQQEW